MNVLQVKKLSCVLNACYSLNATCICCERVLYFSRYMCVVCVIYFAVQFVECVRTFVKVYHFRQTIMWFNINKIYYWRCWLRITRKLKSILCFHCSSNRFVERIPLAFSINWFESISMRIWVCIVPLYLPPTLPTYTHLYILHWESIQIESI